MRRKSASDFDIVVVGGGHAGCEAAGAAARMGFATCLVTIHLETIAQMSCNPAIGGLAKGHLVREIDVLGGLMGLLADRTGIQFRLLNRSRGGAVQAPRAQCDKARYRLEMKHLLENTENLTVFQGIVTEVVIARGRAAGIRTTDGTQIRGRAILLAPGTFLNGVIHIGLHSYPAGRANEPSSLELGENLKRMGLETLRLKTGTPMRLDRNSIDWSLFKAQPGDILPVPFSYRTKEPVENKALCHIGYTNDKTHAVIRKNLNKSPLYSGKITGVGPRYCPSIEDKVIKFPHHSRHQFFLEPEGLDTAEVYVNGLSSSLPFDVQTQILASIPGLDRAKVLRPAYGIEYDAVSSSQIRPTLECRNIPNLYLAGQINGTSGYEEAAAQGLMAGINAGLKILKKPPFVLRRDEAYIGVLIDDLVSRGVEEPYRLFTSRAEFRLLLRIDNADQRLMKYGHNLGLISQEDWKDFARKREKIEKTIAYLKKERVKTPDKRHVTLFEHLKKPEIGLKDVLECRKFFEVLDEEDRRFIESEVKYEGYIKKQEKEIERVAKMDRRKFPKNLDFKKVPGLTREAWEKFEKFKPSTLGEAKKIPGITHAALFSVSVYLDLRRRRSAAGKKCST